MLKSRMIFSILRENRYHVYSDYGMKLKHPVEFATKREAQQYIKDCGCYTKDSEVWIEREEVIENE